VGNASNLGTQEVLFLPEEERISNEASLQISCESDLITSCSFNVLRLQIRELNPRFQRTIGRPVGKTIHARTTWLEIGWLLLGVFLD